MSVNTDHCTCERILGTLEWTSCPFCQSLKTLRPLREDQTSTGHWDRYPHTPGTLYDCPDCESQCFCDDMGLCLFCEIEAAPSAEYREEC